MSQARMEIESVARANGSPRMLLGRNLPILTIFFSGFFSMYSGVLNDDRYVVGGTGCRWLKNVE